MPEPKADRPYIPDYGIPTSSKGTLPYDHVTDRLESARNYWVSTARPMGGHMRFQPGASGSTEQSTLAEALERGRRGI